MRPKVARSVHYCEHTKSFVAKEYRDVTSLVGNPTGSAYPQRDEQGHLLETEYGRCKYRDNQFVTIQELPETAPPGQLPHSADVILENDLVDACKPGDRVAIVGLYRTIASKTNGMTTGVFRWCVRTKFRNSSWINLLQISCAYLCCYYVIQIPGLARLE